MCVEFILFIYSEMDSQHYTPEDKSSSLSLSPSLTLSGYLRGLLVASFFKKGEADRGNAKRFVSTITRQLMTSNWELARGISEVITRDTNLSAKTLSQQFGKLLLQPLLNLELREPTSMVIMIDALDRCEEDNIKVILQLLPKLQESKTIRVDFRICRNI